MKYWAQPQRNTKNATAESRAMRGKIIISLSLATKEAASAAAASAEPADVSSGKNTNADVRLNFTSDFI